MGSKLAQANHGHRFIVVWGGRAEHALVVAVPFESCIRRSARHPGSQTVRGLAQTPVSSKTRSSPCLDGKWDVFSRVSAV